MAEFNALQDTAFQDIVTSLESLKTQVQAWRDKAADWAEKAEDVEVEPGKYSSRHHALKADAHRIATEAAKVAAQAAQTAAETAKTDAQTAQGLAEAAQTAAELARGIAESEASGAETARIAAQAAQSAAEAAQTAAETAKTGAETAATNAQGHESKAQEWAEKAEDVQVETNAYSSLHHAAKSDASRIAAEAARDLAQQYRDSALDYSNLAESYANYAGVWANLTGALNTPASVYHNSTFWMLLNNLADVTASEPTGVNPDWAAIGASVVSVNGKTGAVVIEITDITGLQTAINGKSDTGHVHSASEISSGTFANARIAQSNVTQHQTALSVTESQISNLDKYTQAQVNSLLSGKSDTSHTHDTRYYTETETDSLLAGKAPSVHDHDGLYYRQNVIDGLVAAKADQTSFDSHKNSTQDPHQSNLITPISKSSQWTFQLSDLSKNEAHYRYTSAGDAIAAAPSNTTEAIPIGAIVYVTSAGAGIITIVAGSGATLNAYDGGTKTAGQYDTIAVKKVDINDWEVVGGVS